MGAIQSASMEKVQKIVGVENVTTYLYRVQARFVARVTKENYLCGMLWDGGLQRALRIADAHKEFVTIMDYMAAKALDPLMGEIIPGALVHKVDIPVVDLKVSADAPR